MDEENAEDKCLGKQGNRERSRIEEDDAFSSGNAELKISWTSCQDILEKAGCTDFWTQNQDFDSSVYGVFLRFVLAASNPDVSLGDKEKACLLFYIEEVIPQAECSSPVT